MRTDEEVLEFEIRLFLPVHTDGFWCCGYQIDWPSGQRNSFAAGIDSMQAILLAIQKVGAEIYTSKYHREGIVIWENDGGGYGFPVPSNIKDLLIGDDVNI